MDKSSRGGKILSCFFVLVIIVNIWFFIVDFVNQGILSGTMSAVFAAFEIYIAYLLKKKHEWTIWIFMALGVLHLIFLPTRFLMRPFYLYLIAADLFYIVSAFVLRIFSKDIKCYLDGNNE